MKTGNLFGLLTIGFASALTACNDPTTGYFSPIPQSDSSISTASAPTSPITPTAPASPGGASSGGSPTHCTPQAAQNLRILFVVDASGSTQSDDPGAKVRVGSALDFINNNISDANLSYSFTYFAADEESYDYSTKLFSINVTNPFGTGAQAAGAVNLFQSTYQDVQLNGTDYQDALAAAGALVSADNSANPGLYNYAMIFMSDGEPNRGPDTSSTIDPLVTNLINTVGASRMTLSSVYFSNSPDSDDESLIDKMAVTGNGQYVNGDSSNLNLNTMIQSILSVPTNACPSAS